VWLLTIICNVFFTWVKENHSNHMVFVTEAPCLGCWLGRLRARCRQPRTAGRGTTRGGDLPARERTAPFSERTDGQCGNIWIIVRPQSVWPLAPVT
jgi:hypothetical protein